VEIRNCFKGGLGMVDYELEKVDNDSVKVKNVESFVLTKNQLELELQATERQIANITEQFNNNLDVLNKRKQALLDALALLK